MDEDDVSVFLGGVGDARNLYGTWFLFNTFEEVSKGFTGISSKKYHFTINDIKPVVLARNLVLFSMLDDLAVSTHLSEIERLERLSVVFYVFATQIMPRFAFDHLHKVIDSIIETLDTKAPLVPWVCVYDTDKPFILDALRAWKSTELLNLTSTGKLISQTVSTMMTDDMGRFDLQGSEPGTIPQGCEKEFHCYNKTLLLRAPTPVLKKHDPVLLNLLESDASISALHDHLDKNWQVNTTFLDDDWHLKEQAGTELSYDPYNLAKALRYALETGSEQCLFDHVNPFFESMASTIKNLRERTTVETILGDTVAAMDAIRFDLIDDRDTDAPFEFDCVHLSNVPPITSVAASLISSMPQNSSRTRLLLLRPRSAYATLQDGNLWRSSIATTWLLMTTVLFSKLAQVEDEETGKEADGPTAVRDYRSWRRPTREPFEHEFLLP